MALERRHSGLPPTPSGTGAGRSFRAESSAGSLVRASVERESSGADHRGMQRGIQLEKTRRATVLNDKYILGEELGRGAYGQARPLARAHRALSPRTAARGRTTPRAAARQGAPSSAPRDLPLGP